MAEGVLKLVSVCLPALPARTLVPPSSLASRKLSHSGRGRSPIRAGDVKIGQALGSPSHSYLRHIMVVVVTLPNGKVQIVNRCGTAAMTISIAIAETSMGITRKARFPSLLPYKS